MRSVVLVFAALILLVSSSGVASANCSNEPLRVQQGSTHLPDCRAYELVSPPVKNGGSVVADTTRTRAAGDGSAVGFVALAAFGDPLGTGIGTDYMALRDTPGTPDPGNGWSTHPITPLQSGTTYDGILQTLEPLYVGEFSSDLNSGVFFAQSPVTNDPNTAGVSNLYLRNDLRTPGAGTYTELTSCPFCETRGRPLPALMLTQNGINAGPMRPFFAGMTPDRGHVVFESREPLTADAPSAVTSIKVYEWDHGTVRLASRIPPAGSTQCDDSTQAPGCVASDTAVAGGGVGAITGGGGNYALVPHAISDGSDGHVRIIFTRPTALDHTGQLFMRIDGTSTVQLNASERTTPDASPAAYLDASTDGQRVFFMTAGALTNDAPADGRAKLYMYDTTKPAGSNLTFLNPDNEPADPAAQADGMIGASADGHYAYLIVDGQLVSGKPLLGHNTGIYLWHDGTLRYIGPGSPITELFSGGTTPRQARVTPDGRHLLFSATSGAGLTGYDHGTCAGGAPGCRELYLYNADTASLVCVSCNPSGAPATEMATDQVSTLNGATKTSVHQNEALTDDGSRVFFTTAEALVPEDINGKNDAYEYDTATSTVHLLSTGTSTSDSYFMDASTTGDDAFFVTNQSLVGWDTDQAYDLYDARTSGGFPEPPPAAIPCVEEACRGALSAAPGVFGFSSSVVRPGNPQPVVSSPVKPKKCGKGKRVKRVHGKTRCVKLPVHRRGGKK